MPDSETTEIEEQVEELQSKVEDLEEQAQGRNQVRIETHDQAVEVSSEVTDIETLMELSSEEMEKVNKRALLGEYQVLEEQNLHSRLLGGD